MLFFFTTVVDKESKLLNGSGCHRIPIIRQKTASLQSLGSSDYGHLGRLLSASYEHEHNYAADYSTPAKLCYLSGE